jgi:hypothetical protein
VLTVAVACLTATLFAAAPAEAGGPYVVLRDDGSFGGRIPDPHTVLKTLMKQYDASGSPRPDVMSLWTNFSMDKNDFETLFNPASNDVTGIGLENRYANDGTFASSWPPLRAALLHNNVLALQKRADLQNTPIAGFAEYLFLLELSHMWGPAARIPTSDGGSKDDLIGSPFHWSFWMDAGGSPAGGNRWKDNGDGTFTTLPQSSSDITFSMLDLYLMGMADPSEVSPFGLLTNAVPPPDVIDPFTNQLLSKSSFPHFGPKPVTVTATRRTITIEEIVATNGPRVPARESSPHSFKLGIVLMVSANSTDEDVAKAKAALDPISVALAPAFERATRGRGAMTVVTKAAEPAPDAGPPTEEDGGAPAAPSGEGGGGDRGGCSTAPAEENDALIVVAFAAAGVMIVRLVRRRRDYAPS